MICSEDQIHFEVEFEKMGSDASSCSLDSQASEETSKCHENRIKRDMRDNRYHKLRRTIVPAVEVSGMVMTTSISELLCVTLSLCPKRGERKFA